MGKVISKEEFLARRKFYIDEMIKGKIFIYPTDTIYGIGCDARNSSSVKRIRMIKRREEKPFSVIAPSKDWIVKSCAVDLPKLKSLKRLPGPYTLIFSLKRPESICEEVVGKSDAIGIRIPDNWFSKIISKAGIPFVTTSVNISGEPHMIEVKGLKDEILKKVDYVIDYGELNGNPSTLIDLRGEKEDLLSR